MGNRCMDCKVINFPFSLYCGPTREVLRLEKEGVLNKVAEVDRNMSEGNARVGENWKWFRKIGKREAYLIPLLCKHD